MKRVTEPLRKMGAKIDGRAGGEYTPLSVRGGHLKAIDFQSPVASAQIKSAVLLAGLQAEGTTTVTEPHKSRDHTERMLSMFGVSLREDETSVSIEGGQQLKAAEVFVPGDISSAAFSWQQHRLFLAVKSCFAMSDSIRPGRESSMS